MEIPKREHPQFSLSIFLSSLELSWLSFNGITKGNFGIGMVWDGMFFRCLPIYRHLKKGKTKEHLFLKNSQQTWLETGLKSCQKTWLKNLLKRRGGLSPCGRQGHMGMDPNKSPPPDPCQNGRRKTQKPLAGFHASEHRTKLHLLLWNDFCHHVSCINSCLCESSAT